MGIFDTLGLKIKGDASELEGAARQAEDAVKRIGNTAEREGRNLNLYGERLGRVFGPGEGLHGRLDALEMPLRDVEGGFDRARQAALVFGNKAESSSEKATQGFLLAADAIAAFTSGGVAGIAITAAVAGFALLAKAMQDEAAAAEEAKRAQDEHAEALQKAGSAAVDAGVSIAALNAQEAASASLANVRAVEEERREARLQRKRLKDRLDDARKAADEADSFAKIQRAKRERAEAAAELAAQDALIKNLARKARFARTEAKEAQSAYLNDLKISNESAVTEFVKGIKKTTEEGVAAIGKVAEAGGAKPGKGQGTVAKRAADEAALLREIAAGNRAFDQAEAKEAADWQAQQDEEARARRFAAWSVGARELANAKEAERQADVASFERAEAAKKAAAQAAIGTITSGLFAMAEAGEFSAEKLLQSTLRATGQQLVSRGTLHLMEGLAKGLGGSPAGFAESAQGGAMVAAGLAMGAASGAIGRAGAPAPSGGSATPTDTRASRAADTGTGGEGGTTIINFNGPAYDRRGVASVLASGQRMARHRRVQGA